MIDSIQIEEDGEHEANCIGDGRLFNVGMDPVAAAAAARAENITVNVVGIVDRDGIGGRGEREIEEIARAGGGMSRIVPAQQLSQTVQMMTRKTVTHTIHQVVNRELRQILSSEEREADSHVSHSRTGHLRTGHLRTGHLVLFFAYRASALLAFRALFRIVVSRDARIAPPRKAGGSRAQ